MRERGSRTLPFVARSEAAASPVLLGKVASGSTLYADEASSWDALYASHDTRRINHSVAFLDKDAYTNQAESYFSRLRRAEIGTHHHISGRYLATYANEMAWHEDTRRAPNGSLFVLVAVAAMAHPVSYNWKGVLPEVSARFRINPSDLLQSGHRQLNFSR